MKHLDWYRHRYLPHCDQPGKIQSITIRLGDSMPLARRKEWAELLEFEQRARSDAKQSVEHRREHLRRLERIEAYLDAGLGA